MKILKNLITITAALAGIIGVLALILVLVGFRPFILKSESMEPIYTKGSLCWVNTRVDLNSVEIGDVLVYRSPANTLVLHRLVDKSASVDTSSLPVTMQGDANSMSQDVTLSSINFIGREAFTIPRLGVVVEHILSSNAIWFIVAVFVLLAAVPWESIHRRKCIE
jgi:signal peptidase I